jgi:hypothetical protein
MIAPPYLEPYISIGMADSGTWPKSCRCGATWSGETWRTLSFVGFADGGEDGELELRNCTCGSTLAVKRAATIAFGGTTSST